MSSINFVDESSCLFHIYTTDRDNHLIEELYSNEFKITKNINLEITINKEYFNPGEQIKIEGTALKENGEKPNGIVLVTIDNVYSVPLKDGKFEFENTLWDKIKSGKRVIKIEARDSSGNSGNESKEITINQIPRNLKIIANNSYNPGDKIKINAILLDQSGETMNKEIILTLYNSWGSKLMRQSLTCLLYTSPSPRDLSTSRMPSSA
mgnify:CR=1 FL=1